MGYICAKFHQNLTTLLVEAYYGALHETLQDWVLKRMEDSDIIAKVTEPTDWVNSLVIAEKPKTGKLCVCLDPQALNNTILCLLEH